MPGARPRSTSSATTWSIPLIGTKAAFGLTTGDIMSDDLSLYGRYNRIIGQLGVPWHNIVGNHDLNLDAPDNTYARETFRQTFGPSHYAFEYGGALFLMLDNVDYFGARAPGNGCRYQGRFGERQLAFVANVLAQTPADRLVVVATIFRCAPISIRTTRHNTADCSAFIKLLGERPSISFAGHTHTTEHHYLGGDDRDPGTAAPPSSCDDGGVGLVVERALRSPRRRGRGQPRRHAQRISC